MKSTKSSKSTKSTKSTKKSDAGVNKPRTSLDPLRIVDAKFLAGAAKDGVLPPPIMVEIAFAGRSNVGKSSLINVLLERKSLVRTSSTPGSTRQVNLYEARAADGAVFHFVDLPGYGFARRSKAETASWGELIEGYLSTRVTLAAVVLLVDIRRGLEEEERELIEFIHSAKSAQRRDVEVILVATKLDKVQRSAQRSALDKIRKAAGCRVFGFSALTAEGRVELWRALRNIALGTPATPNVETPTEEG